IDIHVGLRATNFFALYLASWIMGCLMTLPVVIQPVYLKETIGITEGLAGSINSGLQNMSQVATILFIGLVGVASDKYGRRIFIITGFVLGFIFYIVFGHSKDIAMLLGIGSVQGQLVCVYLIRFIIGIGLVMSHPQFVTMVTDYTVEQGRGKGMALHAIMISLGALSVYGLFTQIATKTGVLGLLYLGGLLAVGGALVAGLGLVDKMPDVRMKQAGIKEASRAVSKSFALKVSYFAAFVTRADIAIPSTLLIVWMVSVADRFGYTPVEATARGGFILMVSSLFRLVSFYALGIMLDRIGRTPVLIATLLLAGIGYILIAIVENPFSNGMFVYVCLLGFGKNGAIVATNTLASDAAPKPMRGSILGGLNTIGALGIIFFLQACGYLFDNLSYQSPFLFKGAFNVLFGIWVWNARDRILVIPYAQKNGSGKSY
ncbi:MAG: MFS transporter, partial [Deltaproteobacteria bacterium]|nr:MFS transporter [Deltaproteobacteria bacterium]